MLIHIVAKEPPHQRNVANDWDAILNLLYIFPHQTTQHDGLAIPYAHVRGHLTRAKHGLVNHVLRQENLGWTKDVDAAGPY